jgi:hypothetical protein
MNSLTENLYCTLSVVPTDAVSAHGARLVHEIWTRARKGRASKTSRLDVSANGRLVATDLASGLLPVETAAFNNALRYAGQQLSAAEQSSAAAEQVCCAAPVFAAMALAEARGADCASLFHAVGLGVEAYFRLAGSLADGTRKKGFDAHVIAATLAAIVGCASIEKLPPDKAAQALGLGSSAVTAVTHGYLPLQAATAARDGIVMALLMACEFRGPPDPIACRWGVYETFGDLKDVGTLDVASCSTKAAGNVQRLFGSSASGAVLRGSVSVRQYLESFA